MDFPLCSGAQYSEESCWKTTSTTRPEKYVMDPFHNFYSSQNLSQNVCSNNVIHKLRKSIFYELDVLSLMALFWFLCSAEEVQLMIWCETAELWHFAAFCAPSLETSTKRRANIILLDLPTNVSNLLTGTKRLSNTGKHLHDSTQRWPLWRLSSSKNRWSPAGHVIGLQSSRCLLGFLNRLPLQKFTFPSTIYSEKLCKQVHSGAKLPQIALCADSPDGGATATF